MSLTQLIGIMHIIYKVWGSNSEHHKKDEEFNLVIAKNDDDGFEVD